ncbi:MAG: hypothetical protein ACLSAP_11285 [Oscillospiraceae bacterium]
MMNYPFKDAVLDFVRTGGRGSSADRAFHSRKLPKARVDCLMNSLTPIPRGPSRCWPAPSATGPRVAGRATARRPAYQNGVHLFQLASVLQFFLPGVPASTTATRRA